MIYLAGPLFTAAERSFNKKLAGALENALNEKIFLPQDECSRYSDPEDIFTRCRDGIDRSRMVIAVLDGPDADSGTAFEAGYAHARKIPVIGIRTDFRQCGDDGGLNLMLSKSCHRLITVSSLQNDDCISEIIRLLNI